MFSNVKLCGRDDLNKLSECPMVRRDHRDTLREALIEDPPKGPIFGAEIDRPDVFLKLNLRYQKVTHPIAPLDDSLELEQIIGRMRDSQQDFRTLANEQDDPNKRKWFTRVADIIQKFSYEDFGLIALEPSAPGLLKPEEATCYSIFEGQHRSLALAWRLMGDIQSFKPIQALLLFPRRTSTELR